MARKNTCGIGLMNLLAGYGTEFVFGIPGVHTVELYRGIAQCGIRHVTPRHEQSAGFMADGYARSTGKVGVCCLITGPGVTNAATALAQAWSDSVPVLAVSSVNKTGSLELGQGDLHELPGQHKLTEHFTAFSQTILDVNTVPEVVARAFSVFDSMRPRPVHLEIPIDLIDNEVNWNHAPAVRTKPPEAPQALLEQAAELLIGAQSPTLILGGGCKHASAEALRLAEQLNAVVVTTFAAKGVVSEDHSLSIGANLLHPPVLDFLKEADTVLAVGTHLSETDIWSRGGDIEFDGNLIRVDLEPGQIYRNAMPEIGIIGDARHALDSLSELVVTNGNSPRAERQQQEKLVQELLDSTPPYWYEDTPIHAKVWDVIREELPDDGIVTADSTQLVYSGNFYYRSRRPATYLTSTTGFGTLGYALPAAIGAQLGNPHTPVVCVAGDGGFLFTIQELATAVEHNLPIVIVLWHNDGYGEIRKNFEHQNIPLVGVDLEMPDFIAVAKGFGCHAERLSDLWEFGSMLQAGFRADRPTLLEIRTDLFSNN